MRSDARRMLDTVFGAIEAKYRGHHYRRSTKRRLRQSDGGYRNDKEYKSIVVPYWQRFGQRPRQYWYSLFCVRSKQMDPRYIPDDMWFARVLPYYSNMQFRRAYEDKCMHSVLFPELSRPKTIVMNIAGVFYDGSFRIIGKEEAVQTCLREHEFLIKPSIDSGEGRLITFFSGDEVNRDAIQKIIDSLQSNFMVQEVVQQHRVLANLNEKSLNTIRVISFLFEGEVHILSTILRIGGMDSRVDNVGAGGYACKINPNGRLDRYAVNRLSQWVEDHPSGAVFYDTEVPSYEKVLELVRRGHKKLAHFKIIGWDFAINIAGEPIFIEYNVCPGQNQRTCGPTFGDLTDKVLEDVFIKKSLAGSKN